MTQFLGIKPTTVAHFPPHRETIAETLYQFTPTNLRVWDISTQYPTRKLLGRIEWVETQGHWIVINVDRQPYTSPETYGSYQDATIALRQLTANPRARQLLAQLAEDIHQAGEVDGYEGNPPAFDAISYLKGYAAGCNRKREELERQLEELLPF